MNNNGDPFEEFEFKPITEGLGFHRNEVTDNAPHSDKNSKKNFFSHTLPKENNSNHQTNPFSSSNSFSELMVESNVVTDLFPQKKSEDVVDEILKNIQDTKKMNSDLQSQRLSSQKKSTKITYIKSSVVLPAIFLDMMLVLASTLLCLVLLLTITKVDLIGNLRRPDAQGSIYLATTLLFLCVGFVYYVSYRSFLTYTPGEWAYDQKIYSSDNQQNAMFLLKIALRSLIIIATGVVIIPMISWAMNKDILGNYLDIYLVRKSK